MVKKRLLLALLIGVGICAALAFFINFYISQRLFVRPESDEDLIATLFDTGFPGYASITVLESEGEGIRRIPRQILINVELETIPEPVTCTGEIFFDVGDPMVLGAQWHTLQCIGQHRLMELARNASTSGFQPSDCHQEPVTALFVHWVRTGLIIPGEINSPEFRKVVQSLAEDHTYSVNDPPLNSGLFNFADAVIHNRMGDIESEGFQSYVLRCDGTLDLYLAPVRGQVYQYADIKSGDYLLPSPLEKGSGSILPASSSPPGRDDRAAEVEVTVLPAESCTGWACEVHGIVYAGSAAPGQEISGSRVTLQQSSYCSPTQGVQETVTDTDGEFGIAIFLHDTDQLTIDVSAEGYQPLSLSIHGMDCLNCACLPLELILELKE